MDTKSRHLLLELWNCKNKEILDSPKQLMDVFRKIAQILDVTIVQEVAHSFEPSGLSGVLVISESHLSWHTWPDTGYIAIDYFTCGNKDPLKGIDYLKKVLEPAKVEYMLVHRGCPVRNLTTIEKVK